MYSKLVLTLVLALTMNSLWAQNFSVRLVYPASDGRDCVYSIQIQNTAEDSIMVLHTQEAALPPFINNYKLEEASTKTGGKPLLLFGKSNNPFLPEQYLATKSLGPRETLELYFTLPVRLNEIEKYVQIYYSMMDDKYLADFNKLETTGTKAALKKCKALKEKHGIVHNRKVKFQ
jgi:hypothetical protein